MAVVGHEGTAVQRTPEHHPAACNDQRDAMDQSSRLRVLAIDFHGEEEDNLDDQIAGNHHLDGAPTRPRGEDRRERQCAAERIPELRDVLGIAEHNAGHLLN